MSVHETDLAIRMDHNIEALEQLADQLEKGTMDSGRFMGEIFEIISDLTQIAYEYVQR